MRFKTVLVAAAIALTGTHAFWRMECRGRVGLGRIDPLISPGLPSEHSHTITGSDGFSMTSNWTDLRAGNCSSCRVQADKSAYWTPSLHFRDSHTGEFELVGQVGGMLSYYLLYGENVLPFRPGFSMVAGTSTRRTYTAGDPYAPDPAKSYWAALNQTTQEILAERAIGFNCLNYAAPPEASLARHYLPDKAYLDANCTDGIRAELMFPSCWNGDDHVPKNQKDHMAYPDLVMTGTCPEAFPNRLPSILFETIWDTSAYRDRTGEFFLSNGDKTGFGYHGDFINGWDLDLLSTAVAQCRNPSGRIEDCPVFAPTLVSEEQARSCQMQMPDVLSSDNAVGPAVALPGHIEIANADPVPTPISTLASSALTYTVEQSMQSPKHNSSTSSYDQTVSVTVTTSPSSLLSTQPTLGTAAPTPPTSTETPASPPTTMAVLAPSEPVAEVISTQYLTEGNVVNEIIWEEIVEYVTKTADVTRTVTVNAPGGSNSVRNHRKRHFRGHGHGHRRHGFGF